MHVIDSFTHAIFYYALAFFVVAMSMRLRKVLKRPFKKDLGEARGSSRYGAFYALTFAMLPWKKESTKHHWITYLAGMLMHIGIFLVLLYALALRFNVWHEVLQPAVRIIGPLGLFASVGLFVKRLSIKNMRLVSNIDDYLSNLLVDFYILGGVLTAFEPSFLALWRLGAILLLLWIPIGKIFHMLLFFVSRLLFGWQFGKRGVIRHAAPITY